MLNELDMLIQGHKPRIMVLTETKLIKFQSHQHKRRLEPYLPQYKMNHSRVKGEGEEGRRSGHAEVAIALHESLMTQSSITQMNLQDPIGKGHCKVLKIQPPGYDALITFGICVPCTDMSKRERSLETTGVFVTVQRCTCIN